MPVTQSFLMLFLTINRSETSRLYNDIGNVKMTANGHSYYTGPIETVQLAHYRNLTGQGAWLFSETADVIFNTRSDAQETNPMDDGASEFILTGELAALLWVDKRIYLFTVDNQTNITAGQDASYVLISQTNCLSRTRAGQESLVEGVSVEIAVPEEDCKDNFLFM